MIITSKKNKNERSKKFGEINAKQTGKKNILIYAHYYYPDFASTGQLLKELSEGMLKYFNITVICVVPSYTGIVSPIYKTQKYYSELINGVKVIRIRVPEFNKSKKTSRIMNIITYFIRAVILTFKLGKQDYVYAISQPPVLGGFLGVLGKWIKKAKYIYNIQDFNPEQISAVSYSKSKIILDFMMWIDKFSCNISDMVVLVGSDMVETLNMRYRKKKVPVYKVINNWIDEKNIYPLNDNNQKVMDFRKTYGLNGKFIIMYSGNLGLYYDLENILKVIKRFKDNKEVIFAFVGEGSAKDKLVKYKEENNMDNVVFIPYQDKKDLIYSLNAAHIHWVVNAKGIKGISVPSKLYGVMAVGKPVLGVLEEGSEAYIIIKASRCGLVTEPGDYAGIEDIINYFINNRYEADNMGLRGRTYLENNLTKEISVSNYIDTIENI